MFCCGIIIAGFLLGIDQENGLGMWNIFLMILMIKITHIILFLKGSLTISGVVYGILASLFVALNAIYTKKSLKSVDDNIWKLALYNNFNASIIFLPFMFIFGEHGEVFNFPKLFDSYFWFAMTISGILGIIK